MIAATLESQKEEVILVQENFSHARLRKAQDCQSFEELLLNLKVDSKIKSLWKQIYLNSISDRTNAMVAYTDLYIKCHGEPDMHAIHGQNLAKYLERMEKSNAQLIKLAEMIEKVDSALNNPPQREEVENLTGKDLYGSLVGPKKK
jgi:hypothetical protein